MSPISLRIIATSGEVLSEIITPDSDGETVHTAAIKTDLGPAYAWAEFRRISDQDNNQTGFEVTMGTFFPSDSDWKESSNHKDGVRVIPAGTYAKRRQCYHTGSEKNDGFIIEARAFQEKSLRRKK